MQEVSARGGTPIPKDAKELVAGCSIDRRDILRSEATGGADDGAELFEDFGTTRTFADVIFEPGAVGLGQCRIEIFGDAFHQLVACHCFDRAHARLVMRNGPLRNRTPVPSAVWRDRDGAELAGWSR